MKKQESKERDYHSGQCVRKFVVKGCEGVQAQNDSKRVQQKNVKGDQKIQLIRASAPDDAVKQRQDRRQEEGAQRKNGIIPLMLYSVCGGKDRVDGEIEWDGLSVPTHWRQLDRHTH